MSPQNATLSSTEEVKILRYSETLPNIVNGNDFWTIKIDREFTRLTENLIFLFIILQPNSESLNSDTWTGTDFGHVLEITKSINSKDITNFMSAARQATMMHNTAKELMRTGKETPPTLHHDIIRIVEKTLMGFKMISTAQYTNDYRVVIRQTPLGVSYHFEIFTIITEKSIRLAICENYFYLNIFSLCQSTWRQKVRDFDWI